MNFAEIISKIRDQRSVSVEEIKAVAAGIATGAMRDAQVGAFAMVVLWRGLSEENGVALTEGMRDSGEVLRWDVDGRVVDKHSTGGVGDCVSLVLSPILACAGFYVPMISGRGLGHTGGTLDKLEAIPNFDIHLSKEQMRNQLGSLGCFMAGASAQLAPADQRFYSIRDISGTVPSIDLITASILSKKLAAGLDGLVLDVKSGLGAFMKTPEDAKKLARRLVQVGNDAGCETSALITAMDIPLASSAGNALEVEEVLRLLEGKANDTRLYEVTKALCVKLMEEKYADKAESVFDELIETGEAMARFEDMVAAQNGPKGLGAIRAEMPRAAFVMDVLADDEIEFCGFDAFEVGMCVIGLGGGRQQKDDRLDYSVGIDAIAEPGRRQKGDLLARIHARDEASALEARARLMGGMLGEMFADDMILGGMN